MEPKPRNRRAAQSQARVDRGKEGLSAREPRGGVIGLLLRLRLAEPPVEMAPSEPPTRADEAADEGGEHERLERGAPRRL